MQINVMNQGLVNSKIIQCKLNVGVPHWGMASKPNRRLTCGSIWFRTMSFVVNNDNRLELDGTAGQPPVEFRSCPKVKWEYLWECHQFYLCDSSEVVSVVGVLFLPVMWPNNICYSCNFWSKSTYFVLILTSMFLSCFSPSLGNNTILSVV